MWLESMPLPLPLLENHKAENAWIKCSLYRKI